MSDPKYKNVGTPGVRVIEECSEVIKEICKAERFGYLNYHPEYPAITNRSRILEEIDDLESVLAEFKKKLWAMGGSGH